MTHETANRMDFWLQYTVAQLHKKRHAAEQFAQRMQLASQGPLATLGWLVSTLTTQYAIDASLGKGGSATVYRAHAVNSLDSSSVVLKIQEFDAERVPQGIRMYEEEVVKTLFVAAAETGSDSRALVPAVCPTDLVCMEDFGITVADGNLAGVHVYGQEGVSLNKIIAETTDRPPPVAVRLAIGRHLVSMTRRLHDIGVAHMDLKPHNVLVTDGGKSLRFIDFGVATILGNADEVLLGNILEKVTKKTDDDLQRLVTSNDAEPYRMTLQQAQLFRSIQPTNMAFIRTVRRQSGTAKYNPPLTKIQLAGYTDEGLSLYRDNYALGIMLLEVYHWTDLVQSFIDFKQRDEVLADKLAGVTDEQTRQFIASLLRGQMPQ